MDLLLIDAFLRKVAARDGVRVADGSTHVNRAYDGRSGETHHLVVDDESAVDAVVGRAATLMKGGAACKSE